MKNQVQITKQEIRGNNHEYRGKFLKSQVTTFFYLSSENVLENLAKYFLRKMWLIKIDTGR